MATPTTDAQVLDSLALLFPCVQEKPLISLYVEGHRMMPDDSPFPGPYRSAFTPYAVEIMDSMSPLSPIQHGVMMCSAQIAKTTILENVCSYYMDELPSPILFVSGTESGAEKWATTRLEPMIDSLGFRDKIGPVYNNAKSRKSGDKVFEKLFLGGNLHVVSAQSPGDLASMSKRILLRDEIDRAPPNLRSGEGNWLSVSEARTKAWRYRKKIFDCSTPGDYDVSEINRLYEMGDCRMYFVPCPLCKAEQVLELGDGKEKGLRQIETSRGKEVVYICAHCHGVIEEYQKQWMLENGHWKPTKTSTSPSFASWHINALYSPLGMYSWASVWEKWEIAQNDSNQMKTFINLELGLPYREEGSRPDDNVVIGHRGIYRMGTIPAGVLYLSAGMDVQEGKNNPDPAKPDEGPRLEIEILGHGEDYRSWSIAYLKFYGPVLDPYSGAWEDFYQWCANPYAELNKLESTRFSRSDGIVFPICAIFIDSGKFTDVVYNFCGRAPVFFPSKGIGWLSEEKLKEKGDVAGPANVRHYKIARVPGSDKELFEVATNYYKGEFYTRLRVPRQPLDPNPPGYCDFPTEYSADHFLQLNAETRWKDGSFHKVKTRNEALDCRVYAMAAGESFLMGQVSATRDAMKRTGATDSQIKAITAKWMLSRWAAKLNPTGVST